MTSIALGVIGFFLKKLYDRIEGSASKADIGQLTARIDAFEELLSNFSRDQHRENGEIRTELKWVLHEVEKLQPSTPRHGH